MRISKALWLRNFATEDKNLRFYILTAAGYWKINEQVHKHTQQKMQLGGQATTFK